MKKTLLLTLLLTVSLTSGCPAPQSNNANDANNVNRPAPVVQASATPGIVVRPNHEKDIELTINSAPGSPSRCTYAFDTVGPVVIKKGKGKIRWIAKNNCDVPNGVKVVIEEFKHVTTGKTNPFGDPEDSCDPNKIVIDPIAHGEEGRAVTRTAKGDEGGYTYKVKLFVDGVEQPLTEDNNAKGKKFAPQIEIGG